MNAFMRLLPVGLLLMGALCGAAGAAENALTQLVSQVKAVAPGQWVGWDEKTIFHLMGVMPLFTDGPILVSVNTLMAFLFMI